MLFGLKNHLNVDDIVYIGCSENFDIINVINEGEDLTLLCSIADLIPQKGKMGFAQTLIQAQKNGSESSAVITGDNIFLNDRQQLSNAVLVEYINQLTAGVLGYQARLEEGPVVRKGLFVGLQDAEFFDPVYLGDMLTLHGFVTEEVSQVSFVQGIIERDGKKIAELVTKLYQTENVAELSGSINPVQVSSGTGEKSFDNRNLPLDLVSNMQRKLYSYIQKVRIEDGQISFSIACPKDFEPFDGHFPENPILPGVVLLEIAAVGLEILLGKTIFLKSIKKMKISGMVLPDQTITCEIKIAPNNDGRYIFTTVVKERAEKEISRFNGSCIPCSSHE